jgi:hypothetical protein
MAITWIMTLFILACTSENTDASIFRAANGGSRPQDGRIRYLRLPNYLSPSSRRPDSTTVSMRAIRKVTSGELLTKQAMVEKICTYLSYFST